MKPNTTLPCALVTGGNSGIGRALAAAIVGEGYRVAIAGRHEGRLASVAAETGAQLTLVMDVRDPVAVKTAMDRLETEFGRLDLLVNNAGVARFSNLEDTDESVWTEIIDTNLTGAWRVSKAAMPMLLASGGMMINIASVAGRKAYPGASAYCASKFGLIGMAESLREELRGRGLRVVNILPGATHTPIWDDMDGDWDTERMIRPEDVAQAALAALRLPAAVLMEEIVLRPAGGDL